MYKIPTPLNVAQILYKNHGCHFVEGVFLCLEKK